MHLLGEELSCQGQCIPVKWWTLKSLGYKRCLSYPASVRSPVGVRAPWRPWGARPGHSTQPWAGLAAALSKCPPRCGGPGHSHHSGIVQSHMDARRLPAAAPPPEFPRSLPSICAGKGRQDGLSAQGLGYGSSGIAAWETGMENGRGLSRP